MLEGYRSRAENCVSRGTNSSAWPPFKRLSDPIVLGRDLQVSAKNRCRPRVGDAMPVKSGITASSVGIPGGKPRNASANPRRPSTESQPRADLRQLVNLPLSLVL